MTQEHFRASDRLCAERFLNSPFENCRTDRQGASVDGELKSESHWIKRAGQLSLGNELTLGKNAVATDFLIIFRATILSCLTYF